MAESETQNLNNTSSGLREQKKAQARLAMHKAALELVAEHGFDQVTSEQIAQRAGVSPRTLFNYWLNKEAVVLGIDPAEPDALLESLKSRPAWEEPTQSLRAILLEKAERAKSIDVSIRKLRQKVLRNEPHLSHIFMSENAKVQQTLIDAWAQRLAQQHPQQVAEELAIVYVSTLTAILRSARTMTFQRDLDLAQALETLFGYLDQGALRF